MATSLQLGNRSTADDSTHFRRGRQGLHADFSANRYVLLSLRQRPVRRIPIHDLQQTGKVRGGFGYPVITHRRGETPKKSNGTQDEVPCAEHCVLRTVYFVLCTEHFGEGGLRQRYRRARIVRAIAIVQWISTHTNKEQAAMSIDRDDPVVNELPTGPPPEVRPRFQFGISTLLWIMTGTAVICALLFPMPSIIAIPVLLFVTVVVMPAVWTTIIVYARGYRQTFAIGAIFPTGLVLFSGYGLFRGMPLSVGPSVGDETVFRLVLFLFWLSSFLVGAICVGVRRYLERHDSRSTANSNCATQTTHHFGE